MLRPTRGNIMATFFAQKTENHDTGITKQGFFYMALCNSSIRILPPRVSCKSE